MPNREDIDRLLDRIGVFNHPCDVDLLLFFAHHPRALVTSEQLAAWLGYELVQIAASLDVLLEERLLTRTQHRAHAARLYVFSPDDSSGDWLPPLLALVATRPGRLAIRQALARRTSRPTKAPEVRGQLQTRASSSQRAFVVRRSEASATKAG